jgi:hypothetical protein
MAAAMQPDLVELERDDGQLSGAGILGVADVVLGAGVMT